MSTLDKISHNLRDTVDQLAEGWQEFWQRARSAIIRFTPTENHEAHPLGRTGGRWGVLTAELRETNDSIEVHLEAPGMNAADFDIQVHNQSLRIRGSKSFSDNREEGHYHITERAYGRFERIIPLPAEVDDKTAVAHYNKGVLELSIKKHASAQPRRITVE